MKTVFLTILLSICLYNSMSSQSVSGASIHELDVEYIKLDMRGMKSNKVTIDLDFGQYNEPFNGKDLLIMDEYDKPMEFNSIIEAINFMTKMGYELDQVVTHSTDTSSSSSYILRKKKSL